ANSATEGKTMLLIHRDALPSVAELARPMLRLAGTRIDPMVGGAYRSRFDRAIEVVSLPAGEGWDVSLPSNPRIGSVVWAPDSRHFAFTQVTESGTELWISRSSRGATPFRLSDRLNTVFFDFAWAPDSRSLWCVLIPTERGATPVAGKGLTGPVIQESRGESSPLRTYQDLLTGPDDVALFEHHARGVSARLRFSSDERTAEVDLYGEPAIHVDLDPSPDGRWLMLNTLKAPYSYLMPWWKFARDVKALRVEDRKLATIESLPLQESVPIGGVHTGRRNVRWLPAAPATLLWAQALDGGDPKAESDFRDAWYRLDAPFEGEPRALFRLPQRATRLDFFVTADRVVATEYDRDRRWTRVTVRHLDDPDASPVVIEDRSVRDRYGDPGRLMKMHGPGGKRVIRERAGWIYRSGAGASSSGDRPFLDRQHLQTLKSERLWQSAEDSYEAVIEIVGDGKRPRFITRHEDPKSPPNFRMRTVRGKRWNALTAIPHPAPELLGVRKQLVTYERADGVPLSATLYLPAGYKDGTRLPLLVWAYPREFNDARTAGQVTGSPSRFTRIEGSSHLHLLSQGYAIMDGATMPIIGNAETMNDTFIEQLVQAAEAAIETAVAMGVADRERVAVAGHSYGAFMTANLLAHSDLFAAGIARSGAYNRTLTPFGFQSERRTLWEAPETYFAVSPFMHADKIDAPLLLIHGEADNNAGTYPMQSRRLFQAIKGHGGSARLVMLPHESHGYRGRESILHVLAEMIDWLDEHAKKRD
ncbi:MAG: prolyl oligopeptidase family serine peptidase, partial [Acidobacteriota bacterium]|nr:prolyl oligopeptidase family serine peptidase [Acidobacteriota bacterium]